MPSLCLKAYDANSLLKKWIFIYIIIIYYIFMDEIKIINFYEVIILTITNIQYNNQLIYNKKMVKKIY